MLESGAFASPYTPTVASQVTRLADSAVMTGVNFSSWFNPSEGTFFLDGQSPLTLPIQADNGANDNLIRLAQRSAGSGLAGYVRTSASDQVSINQTFTADYDKGSLSYKTNDCLVTLNGASPTADTTVILPVVNTLRIGAIVGTAGNGYIKRLTYYPQALTSANLQAVTR
jgi:hypothetical protein